MGTTWTVSAAQTDEQETIQTDCGQQEWTYMASTEPKLPTIALIMQIQVHVNTIQLRQWNAPIFNGKLDLLEVEVIKLNIWDLR